LFGGLTMAIVGCRADAPVKPAAMLTTNILADEHVAHARLAIVQPYLIPVENRRHAVLVALVVRSRHG